MRLQRHLFMAAFVLSTVIIPCLAQAARSPEISEQDLAPYKALGSGSIEGFVAIGWTENNDHLQSFPEHVKVSVIPATPYTQWYLTEYRNVVLHGPVKLHPHGFLGIAGTQPGLPLPYLDQRIYRLVRSTITQADGSYYLKNIAPGSYFVIAEWAITSRQWIEDYTYNEPSYEIPGPGGVPQSYPGEAVDLPAHWEAYRFLSLETSEEPIVLTNTHTYFPEDKLENRHCVSDSCGEFVQDQFFPKENSLVIHQATLAPT